MFSYLPELRVVLRERNLRQEGVQVAALGHGRQLVRASGADRHGRELLQVIVLLLVVLLPVDHPDRDPLQHREQKGISLWQNGSGSTRKGCLSELTCSRRQSLW